MGPNMGAINTTAHIRMANLSQCLTQFTGIGGRITTANLHMLTISHRIFNNSSISEAAFQ